MDMWIWTSWLVYLLINLYLAKHFSVNMLYIYQKYYFGLGHLLNDSSKVKRAMYMGRSASPVRISLMAEKEKNKVNANF